MRIHSTVSNTWTAGNVSGIKLPNTTGIPVAVIENRVVLFHADAANDVFVLSIENGTRVLISHADR